MCRSLVVLIVAATPLLAAPGVKEKGKEPVLYFPVKEGTQWVTETQVRDQKIEAAHSIRKVETRDGTHTVTVDSVVRGGTQTAVYEVSASGVVLLPPRGKEALGPFPVLKLPARPEDSWEFVPPGARAGVKMSYIVGPQEDVEVPAGKFKAVPVTSVNHLGGRIQKTRHWFAPGVGLIKTAPFDGDEGGTEVLKSFTPGK